MKFKAFHVAVTGALGAIIMAGVGCAGGPVGSSSVPGANGAGGVTVGGATSGSAQSTAVLINIGDFASVPELNAPKVDRIVSFQLTIDSVTFRSSTGDVPWLSQPRRLELTRLSSRFEPLLVRHVPQGDYSPVVIGVSDPQISFIDSSGVLHENVAPTLASSSETLNIQLSIGSTPTLFSLVPLADSVSFADDAVTVTPRFGLGWPASSVQIDDLVGSVTSMGSNSFAVCGIGSAYANGTFTFTTDSNTQFQGVTGVGGLTTGFIVSVSGRPKSDGSLLATKVKVENNNPSLGLVIEGITLSMAPGRLQMLVRQFSGLGAPSPTVGGALTLDANAATQFRVDRDNVDLNNLNFTPTFDALNMVLGQNVRVSTSGSDIATSIPFIAEQLTLEPQSFDGIASASASGSVSGQFTFTLELSGDSAFAHMTGHNSVLVTLQPSSRMFIFSLGDGCISCITNQPVRVRGLLFFSKGQYQLVADQLAEN
jgi:Domain of unknown function (DUF5666)